MNCRQTLRLLYEIIDREAGKGDTAEVEKHLKSCRHCMEQYEFEQMFKTLIINKGKSRSATDRIKQKIADQIDNLDAAGEVGLSRSPFRWATVALASAAALVICVAASFWIGDYYRIQNEIVPFVEAFAARATIPEGAEYASDPYQFLEDQTGIKMNPLLLGDTEIQSVSVETIKGIEFGRLDIICPHNGKLSIFVTPADRYSLPIKPVEEVNGRSMLVYRCHKCSMIGEKKKDMIFLIAALPCCSSSELAQFSSSL